MNGPTEIVRRSKVGIIIKEMPKAMYLPDQSNEINREAEAEYKNHPEKYDDALGENKEFPYITIEEDVFYIRRRKVDAIVITCPYKDVNFVWKLLHKTSTQNKWKFISEDMKNDKSASNLYFNAQHHHEKFTNKHDTIQIFNVDAKEFEDIKAEIENLDGVVSTHRTFKTDQKGRWSILVNKKISTDDLEQIDKIIENIPLNGPHQRIFPAPPRQVIFAMEKVSKEANQNLHNNFDHRPQQKNAWHCPPTFVQPSQDEASTGTAITKGTEVAALEDRVRFLEKQLSDRITDGNKQLKNIERERREEQRDMNTRVTNIEKKLEEQALTML